MGKNKKGKKKWHKRNETATKVADVSHAAHKTVLRGGPAAKMAKEDLFVVDTVKKLTRAQRKAMARDHVLAVDKKVAQNPHVRAVGVKANKRPGTKGKGADRAVLARTAAAQGKDSEKDAKPTAVVMDPWSVAAAPKLDEIDPYLAGAAKLVQGSGAPKRRGKARELPAVEVPHEGASYHPDPAAHAAALRMAVDAEKLRVKKVRDADRAAPPRKVPASVVEGEVAFYRQGLFEGEDGEEDGEESGAAGGGGGGEVGEHAAAAAAQRAARAQADGVRMTRRERAKAAARESERSQQSAAKQDKLLGKMFDNVRHIAKAVRSDEAQRAERLAERKRLREEREATHTKRFGRERYQPADMAVPLTEDLTGSLRTIKPVGTLLIDRQDSVRKRNLVEVTRKRKRRRVWRKVKEVGKQKGM